MSATMDPTMAPRPPNAPDAPPAPPAAPPPPTDAALSLNEAPAAPPRRRGRAFRALRATIFILAALTVAFARPATYHARATTLLLAFSDPNAHPPSDVAQTSFTFPVPASPRGPARDVRAYLYSPRAPARARDAPAVVLVHGVHRLGIEEPRLQRFARALAAAGVVVMTPEVEELADYHVAPRSIDTVGAALLALRDLRARTGRANAKIGLMGTSFGGGIALLAAADPRFADDVSFVVTIGAHDDLARVSRFFVTNEAAGPDGARAALHAHEYGATVLVYAHVEDFFPPADVPAARDALRLWLHEQRDGARAAARSLSPPSAAKVDSLFAADVAPLRDEVLREIDQRAAETADVSPHGHLAGLRAKVYILHGAGDTVIPATEARWLASDVPPGRLGALLVSPAIVHVELDKPHLYDEWELVHFMGSVLAEASSSASD